MGQIGYNGTSNSLLASGIYGIVKVVATAIFVFFLVDSLGRKLSLFISGMGMGILFFIIGALLKEFPPPAAGANPPPASKAMAAMLYLYVCFYSLGWGPLPCALFPYSRALELADVAGQMGIRGRHLPHQDAPLRSRDRERLAMAVQYVHSRRSSAPHGPARPAALPRTSPRCERRMRAHRLCGAAARQFRC